MVSARLILYGEFGSKLTFGDFYQAAHAEALANVSLGKLKGKVSECIDTE